MAKYRKASHVVYKCDYHIVWVPKYRFRILKGAIKELVEQDIRMLCDRTAERWKGCIVEELNVQDDHVHVLASVPPKISILQLMGILRGKIAIKLYPKLKQKPYWRSPPLGLWCIKILRKQLLLLSCEYVGPRGAVTR